jgi:hypothetical protein
MPPPTKESLAKPLDNDSMASTSELPLPPVTQSSPTVQELLKQDDKKQYIPFVKMPAAGKNDWPVPPAAPLVHKTENYDEATQGKMLESLKLDSHQDLEIEEKVHYADAAAAARAAAESADHAVAAARAAAELAIKETEHGKVNSSKITAPTAGNVEDGSGTNFDINDGHDRAPISTEMSQGRYASETMPLPNSDFRRVDDNNLGPLKDNDVPHGQDAGGMVTGTPMKLQFDAPEYDDDDQNRKGSEDSIFYQSETAKRHAFQHTDEGKFAVDASIDQDLNRGGFSESQDDKLRWQSTELKEPSGRFDIFDINLARPVNSYSAFSSSDYDLGKTSVDGDPEDFRSAKTYGFSNDQETPLKKYTGDENQRSFGGRPFRETRESSPLFDEEYVGRSQSLEHSRLGAAPSGSGYGEQYDEFPMSNLEAATSTGAWGQQTMHSSSDQPPEHLSPTIESSLPSSESLTTGHTLISSLPESYEDDLLARFKALKQY